MNQLKKPKTSRSTKCAHTKRIRRCNELVKLIIRFHAVHTLISTVTLFKSKLMKHSILTFNLKNYRFGKQNTGFLRYRILSRTLPNLSSYNKTGFLSHPLITPTLSYLEVSKIEHKIPQACITIANLLKFEF
jgi:hypothetical protein